MEVKGLHPATAAAAATAVLFAVQLVAGVDGYGGFLRQDGDGLVVGAEEKAVVGGAGPGVGGQQSSAWLTVGCRGVRGRGAAAASATGVVKVERLVGGRGGGTVGGGRAGRGLWRSRRQKSGPKKYTAKKRQICKNEFVSKKTWLNCGKNTFYHSKLSTYHCLDGAFGYPFLETIF